MTRLKMSKTYFVEILQNLWLFTDTFQLFIEEDTFYWFSTVTTWFIWVFEINLFQQLPDEILIKVSAKLLGKLKFIIYGSLTYLLEISSSLGHALFAYQATYNKLNFPKQSFSSAKLSVLVCAVLNGLADIVWLILARYSTQTGCWCNWKLQCCESVFNLGEWCRVLSRCVYLRRLLS